MSWSKRIDFMFSLLGILVAVLQCLQGNFYEATVLCMLSAILINTS